jgi:hypothetical protein
VKSLMQLGICAFDVDCFETLDGVLIVGHPTEITQRLNLEVSPDLLSLNQLRDEDGGQSPTVLDFLAAVSEVPPSCAHNGNQQRMPLRILIEPKGSSASERTVAALAAAVRECGLRDDEVGVWMSDSSLADAASATGILAPLLPVKGGGGSSGSSSSLLPQQKEDATTADDFYLRHWTAIGPPVAHPALAQLSSLARKTMSSSSSSPALNSAVIATGGGPDPPSSGGGGATISGSPVGMPVASMPVAVITWVVDDREQLMRAVEVAAVDGVVSNDPQAMLAEVAGLCNGR